MATSTGMAATEGRYRGPSLDRAPSVAMFDHAPTKKLTDSAAETASFYQTVHWMRVGVPRQMLIELGGVSRRRWEAAREYCERVGVPYTVQKGRVAEPSERLVSMVVELTSGRVVSIETLFEIAASYKIDVMDIWIAYKAVSS